MIHSQKVVGDSIPLVLQINKSSHMACPGTPLRTVESIADIGEPTLPLDEPSTVGFSFGGERRCVAEFALCRAAGGVPRYCPLLNGPG